MRITCRKEILPGMCQLNKACFLTFYLFPITVKVYSQSKSLPFIFRTISLNTWIPFCVLLLYDFFPSYYISLFPLDLYGNNSVSFVVILLLNLSTCQPAKLKYSSVPMEIVSRSGHFAVFVHCLSIILRDMLKMFVLWYCKIYMWGL